MRLRWRGGGEEEDRMNEERNQRRSVYSFKAGEGRGRDRAGGGGRGKWKSESEVEEEGEDGSRCHLLGRTYV